MMKNERNLKKIFVLGYNKLIKYQLIGESQCNILSRKKH